jgi:hypothetical protein
LELTSATMAVQSRPESIGWTTATGAGGRPAHAAQVTATATAARIVLVTSYCPFG